MYTANSIKDMQPVSAMIIFDFDGVIADSEYLANELLAEIVSELGVPTTLEDCYQLYMGKRFEEIIGAIEASIGRPVPENFPGEYQKRTLDRFRDELVVVDGVREYIKVFQQLPQCIASSSSPDRLALCLEVLGLQENFGGNVFSASNVARGKPHPDIFLHAANQMKIAPSKCIVIEDSTTGVKAGVAAGMTVIGLTAASHIQPEHSQKLLSAGAQHIATSFREVEEFTHQFLGT